jgi:LacI family transcriptional regulator, galactose operon repressor
MAEVAKKSPKAAAQEGGRQKATNERAARRRVTMTDVARLAECSQSTVSVVLNNTPGIQISASTRERVFAAARQLEYEIARSAAVPGDRPLQVAVIFDRIATSPEAVVSIDGVREAAWTTGHVVTICETLDNPEMQERALSAVIHSETDLLVFATIMTRKVEVPRRLYAAKPPVVLLNCYSDDHAFPSVVPGEVAGGHRATGALVEAGHRRIAIITGEMWMDAARDRLKGYRQALATADIPYDPALVREGNWQPSAGYDQTNALLDLPRPPSAIFCSNDRMAVGCYEALKERRLAIPDDVSVIGYDDEEVARHLTPQLTTLVLPHREMGRWAVEHGLALFAKRRTKYPITKLECPLIQRASIASPRAALNTRRTAELQRG